MDKKLTDNEIVKALKCCISSLCAECPFKAMNCDEKVPMAYALSLINRLQEEKDVMKHYIDHLIAENERLKKANGLFEYLNKAVYFRSDIPFEFKTVEARDNAINKMIDKLCNIQTAKTEAYKEFAERLKEKAKPHYFDNCNFAVPIDDIDNLLKKLVGNDI